MCSSDLVENIFVFELKLKSRTYDEKELIHNLYLDQHDYEYVNLTKSKYTLGTVIRAKSSVEAEKIKIGKINQLLDKYTTNYAVNILNWYLLFVLISFVLMTFIIVRGDWNRLEPWTFLLFGLPLVSYIINLLFQIIFKKSISLKPTNIYNWLKRNKQKKVSQELQL